MTFILFHKRRGSGWSPLYVLCVLFMLSTVWGRAVVSDESMECAPMWSQSDIPGGQDSMLVVHVPFHHSISASLAVVFFEYRDAAFLGKRGPNGQKHDLCDAEAIKDGACAETELGRYLVQSNSSSSFAPITTFFMTYPTNKTEENQFKYIVPRLGYYCMDTTIYGGTLEDTLTLRKAFVNPYGMLPAEEYPHLPFYASISIIYLVIGLLWMVKSVLHWREILVVQHWIAAVLFTLMLDNAFHFGYYENWNLVGYPSAALLGVISLLNATRNTLSLFVLLIVALGYGVVKPTLGSDFKKCVTLAVALFFCCVLFNAGNQMADHQNIFQVLFVVLPLSLTMTVFFSWTLSALKATILVLQAKRQTYKITMYIWLYRILALGAILVLLFMLIDVVLFPALRDRQWLLVHWPTIWFWRDGWMNVVYMLCFVSVLVLWRPTSNNARYGLEELPSDGMEPDDLEMAPTDGLFGQNLAYRGPSSPRAEGEHLVFDVAEHLKSETDYSDDGGDSSKRAVFGLDSEDDRSDTSPRSAAGSRSQSRGPARDRLQEEAKKGIAKMV